MSRLTSGMSGTENRALGRRRELRCSSDDLTENRYPGLHPGLWKVTASRSKEFAMQQRKTMIDLFTRFNGNETKVVNAYAQAEESGNVFRKSNKRQLSSLDYARRLFRDGTKKGWLP